LSANTGVTDGNGRASVTVTSSSSGPASITASIGTAQITQQVNFVATAAATLILQANPGAVSPNAGTSTNNQAALSALVQDSAGNPVSGAVVNFTAVTDPSNGSISPGSATTGPNGTAVAQFIAGPISTSNNGVVLRATVQGTGVTGTASLTVNQQALFIAIFTGNTIGNVNETTYRKLFSVSVTDANGAAVAGRSVTLSVIPSVYMKGRLVFSTASNSWVRGSFATCANEDRDRDGTLDTTPLPIEDTNGDGRLTPGLPVTVDNPTVITDSAGQATFNLLYGENMAPWLNVDITARTNVGGTESTKVHSYELLPLSSDVTDQNVAPAGLNSPFGTTLDCTVSN
jgi:hypothetical protein